MRRMAELLTHCLVDASCASVGGTAVSLWEVRFGGPIPRGQGLLRTPHQRTNERTDKPTTDRPCVTDGHDEARRSQARGVNRALYGDSLVVASGRWRGRLKDEGETGSEAVIAWCDHST